MAQINILQIIHLFDKKYIKMKGRERHLPDSCLEHTDHEESGCIRSFQLTSAEEVVADESHSVG